tara:strand:+ start:107 stop:469 length:363 start_codon:yes stop_codon:yes gene_type:complete
MGFFKSLKSTFWVLITALVFFIFIYPIFGESNVDKVFTFLGRFIGWIFNIGLTSVPIIAGFFIASFILFQLPNERIDKLPDAFLVLIPTIVAIIFYFLGKNYLSIIGFNFDIFDVLFNFW